MPELFDGVDDATNSPSPDTDHDPTRGPDPTAILASILFSLFILFAAFVSLEAAGIYLTGVTAGLSLSLTRL